MFTDASSGRPLPAGTVLLVPSTRHQGLLAYDRFGQQVVLHNSKKLGRAAVSRPEELNDGTRPVVILRLPLTPQQGAQAVQRAWQDVQRGVRWTWFNNCEDFVNRAYRDQKGSPTRDLVFGGLCFAGLLFAIVNVK